MNYENFYLNIYEFPNGLKIDCRPQGLRIYINIEFSGMVERIIDDWECKKKDCKGNETCIYHLSGKSKAGVKQLRKDLEDLLWDLYSLGSWIIDWSQKNHKIATIFSTGIFQVPRESTI